MGSSDTRSSVLDWFVGNGELGEVVTDHLRSDFDLVENFSVVDSDDGADHLWNDDHVSQMGLDWSWLLVCRSVLLGLSELLDETHWLALESSLELSSRSSVDNVHQLFGREVEKRLEINSSELESSEGSGLLQLGSLLRIVFEISVSHDELTEVETGWWRRIGIWERKRNSDCDYDSRTTNPKNTWQTPCRFFVCPATGDG